MITVKNIVLTFALSFLKFSYWFLYRSSEVLIDITAENPVYEKIDDRYICIIPDARHFDVKPYFKLSLARFCLPQVKFWI